MVRVYDLVVFKYWGIIIIINFFVSRLDFFNFLYVIILGLMFIKKIIMIIGYVI